MPLPDPLFHRVEQFQNFLIECATSGGSTQLDYKIERDDMLSNPRTKELIPEFVYRCRDGSQFWQFIKRKYGTYQERREYLWGEFRPLLEHLERNAASPIQQTDAEILHKLSADAIQQVWTRASHRVELHPEGAITSARELIETTCKHILDDLGIPYDDDDSLPKLNALTSNALNLAPSNHSEQVFKQILGSCSNVVEGLGSLRNRLGDAHGKGKRQVKPSSRHARLAVNLAGAMTLFLVETWENKKKGEKL